MGESENTRVVQEMFAAFAKGDLPGILDTLTEDIEWRLAGPTEVSHVGVRHGRDKVAELFMLLASASEFEVFEPQEYIAQGDKVVVLGHERQRIKATGQVVDDDWVMIFTLRDGKIARFRNFLDTDAHRGT